MKSYSAIIISIVVLAVASATGFMWYAQPISGDITRTGAFIERDYGWNEPQQAAPKHTQTDAAPGKASAWVIGDSFSEAGRWQAYLTEDYHFRFTHLNHISRHRLLQQLATDKPELLLIEIGERGIPDFFDSPTRNFANTRNCAALDALPATEQQPVNWQALQTRMQQLPQYPLYQRATRLTQVNQISQGLHYAKLHLEILRKPSKRKGTAFPLTRDDLMSNRNSGELLIYYADLLMKDYPSDQSVQTIQCNMETLAAELRALNINFVLLAVADKSSVYAPYLQEPRFHDRQPLLNRLDLQRIPEAINLLPIKRAALAAGTVDLYLPNDTHWGYRGYQLTAAAIRQHLTARQEAIHD